MSPPIQPVDAVLKDYLERAQALYESEAELIRYWHTSKRKKDDPELLIRRNNRDKVMKSFNQFRKDRIVPLLRNIPGGIKAKRESEIKFMQVRPSLGL